MHELLCFIYIGAGTKQLLVDDTYILVVNVTSDVQYTYGTRAAPIMLLILPIILLRIFLNFTYYSYFLP